MEKVGHIDTVFLARLDGKHLFYIQTKSEDAESFHATWSGGRCVTSDWTRLIT